ncbi:MAG: LacI family transcriptional regulator [Rhodobacterales bacterium CG2_30_65_12]|nr:MAG: LacI family transcriptional regulator [Rhodobacterales bacterium CG2_30_65_12]
MPQDDPWKNPKRATIHDVARKAGVSAATVSKVMRGIATVKAANAERVREAVAALDYRIDPIASGLRGENRRIIGAVIPDLESPFFGALVTGLERAAEEAGYHMIVASSRESEAREADLIARMNDWRVAGTVLVPVRSERGSGTRQLKALDMQAVLVDRVSADDRYDTVTADNSAASAAVADLLIGAGHRHILLHGATRTSKAMRTRLEGFVARANALDPSVTIDTQVSDDTRDVQRRAIKDYFEAHAGSARPSAVFSLSQHSTLLVLSELRRRAVAIPDDIALVGFDDADWMQTTWPSITAVAQPVAVMAEAAVAALLARVEGEATAFPVSRLEPCRMILRESAGPDYEMPRRFRRGG